MALEKVLRPLASTLVRKVGERASVGKPFYSPIDQAIANITQGTGTGQQMLAELLKTKGVAKELKDRPAIKKALEAAKDTKVTKADVERVAAENPTPQVQHRESDTTEYEQWQMPGGENRRNILLRLPNPAAERNAQIAAQIRDLYQGIGWSNQHMAKFPHLSVDEIPRIAHSEQEIARLRKELAALPRTPDMYEGGHFDEKNILAHARVADYYDNNGKKILLIDEIQSDWHQTARDARKNEIKRLMKAEGIDKATANERVPKEFGYAMPETQRLKGVAQPDDQGGYKVVWEDGTFSGGYSKEGAEAKALEGKSNATSGVVPDAPFKQNWHELVMKRLLDDAARNGYDKVVITPGAEQANRYDLSKQISRVVYSPTTETLNAFDNSGKSVLMKSGITPERVEDYIGKEPAKKLLDPQNTKSYLRGGKEDSYHEITGEDLRVGGEGMTGFYDQIIPSFLNDYGKKYGVTVGTHDLVVPRKNPLRRIQDAVDEGHITAEEVSAMNQPQRNAFMDQFQTRVNPVHSFDITPQMREEITTKGQPLYQVAPPVAIGAGAAMQEEEPAEYAGGGIIKKAGQIIGKAAQSSGMAPPVTATKNLTTMQDFHTSLGDRIRENALEAQKQMESFDYKYDKGQRVFTQDSAAKNKPPYTILGRTRVGNRPMTEDGTIMGKKIIDPETGKTKRTPYEPGYRVRYENGDDWSEFDIPATAIMGDVEMAKGGQVSKDAMWIALQNKQLRKKHGN